MGHYDSCYESDEKEQKEEIIKQINKELKSKTLQELWGIRECIENFDVIRNFLQVLKKWIK